MTTLKEAFETLPEHRGRSGRLYRMESLLLLTLVGFMYGCNSLASVARFGWKLDRSQREALGFLWFQMPSHPTLCIFFQALDVDALEAVLSRLVLGKGSKAGKLRSSSEAVAPTKVHLAVDGKSLCGSASGEETAAHMLAVFADELKGVVAQKRGKRGYNEVTTVVELLQDLPLDGAVVTGDAMFADKKFCTAVRAGKGDYVLPVKENQPSLCQAIEKVVTEKKTTQSA